MRALLSARKSRGLMISCLLCLCLSRILVVAPALARTAEAQFDEQELVLGGGPGTIACAEVGVSNVGDEYLDDICFYSLGGGGVIPHDAFEFIPPCMSLAPGESETLRVCVSIPLGLMAGIYQGAAYLEAAGGSVYDDILLNVFVECVPAMDILDDEGAMSGNELELEIALGESTQYVFWIANIGNCALTGIEGPEPTGPPLIIIPHISPTCEWGETISASVEVRLVEPGLPPGSYAPIMFVVTEEGGATDYFWLAVDVATAVESASWSRVKALFRSP